MAGITHSTVVGVADDDTSPVGTNEWNADHVVPHITFDTTKAELEFDTALAFTPSAAVAASFADTNTSYYQVVLQNKSSGTGASTDLVLTSNLGTDTAEYIDLGINSSGFTGSWGAAKDGYLYVEGGASGVGSLVIGTAQPSTYVDVQVGGGASSNRVVRFDSYGMLMTNISSEPGTPSSGFMEFYSKAVCGRSMPKFKGPSGLDSPLQPALFGNRILSFNPSTGTTGTGSGTGFGPAWTSNGTVTHPTPATTAPAVSNQMKRTRYANVVTTTNQQLGPRFAAASEQQFWRGNAAGLGGFFFATRFIVELWAASTCRIFAGLSATSTGSVCISDTVLNNTCGLWHDTTDPNSGANSFNFVTRDTTTTTKTSIALSNAIAAGNSYDFYMFCPPNGSTIYYRLDDLVNSVTYEGSTSTTLPQNTAFMQPQVQMSNGTANVTVTTVAIGVAGIYVESDR